MMTALGSPEEMKVRAGVRCNYLLKGVKTYVYLAALTSALIALFRKKKKEEE